MDMLFFLLFVLSIIALIIGIIKPDLVVRWGEVEKRNRKNVFKFYGLAIIIFFFLLIFSIPSVDDENIAKREDEIKIVDEIGNLEEIEKTEDIPYAKEIVKIDKNISNYFKGENHSIEIDGQEGSYNVSITFDAENDRFIEPIWCGINGLSFLKSIKKYQPELDEEINTYELIFFAENYQTYSATVDNVDIIEITKLDLVPAAEGESVIVTSDDVEKFHEEEEEKKAKAEKEKYNTGITVEDMARDKDGLKGSFVKLSGKVLQVINGTTSTQYRMAVNDDYKQVIFLEIANIKLESNILEDDYITIEGTSIGNVTYKTVLGAEQTIPGVIIDNFYY